jgi:aarF domain-containing kinase
MKGELADECDYTREASYITKFGSPSFLGNDSRFKVPWVWEGSTETVLVMEHVDGVSVGEAAVGALSQTDRNDVGFFVELCSRIKANVDCGLIDCYENHRALFEGTF